MSDKRRARQAEAKPVRDMLIAEVGHCEHCHCVPGQRGKMPELTQLAVHEIARGVHRQKALDKRFATLVLCWECNSGPFNDKSEWPEARQLAVIAQSRLYDFDLEAYLQLTSPRAPKRITLDEVIVYMDDELLKVEEVAERMRVNRRTVQSWIDDKQLPAIDCRPSGAQRALWRVRPDDLLRFAQKRKST